MNNAPFVLLVIAVIIWFLAAIGWPEQNRVSLGWLGMFFFGLSLIFGLHH